MNRTPSSRPSPPMGEKVPGGRLRGIPTGSWPQLTSKFWRCSLSMSRPTPGPSQEGNSASVPDIGSPPPEGLGVGSWLRFASKFWRFSLSMNHPLTPSLSPSDGERVAGGRVRGGSWCQCMRKNERGLPLNLVAADVSRRTCLLSRQRIRADSRRRLRFMGSLAPPNCDTTGCQDCFSPASCFLIAHHAAAYQDRPDAVLADAAYFGAGIEPAHSLVELSGRLASRRRRERVDVAGGLPRHDLPLPRRDVFERCV